MKMVVSTSKVLFITWHVTIITQQGLIKSKSNEYIFVCYLQIVITVERHLSASSHCVRHLHVTDSHCCCSCMVIGSLCLCLCLCICLCNGQVAPCGKFSLLTHCCCSCIVIGQRSLVKGHGHDRGHGHGHSGHVVMAKKYI